MRNVVIPASAPAGTYAPANTDISAAEAAFEAAMFGAFTHSSSVKQVGEDATSSTGETIYRPAAAAPSSGSLLEALPPLRASKQTDSAPVAGESGGRGTCAPPIAGAVPEKAPAGRGKDVRGGPASSLTVPALQPPAQPKHLASTSSEEAFERALCNEFFEVSDSQGGITENTSVVTMETRPVSMQEEGFEAEHAVEGAEKEKWLPGGSVAAMWPPKLDVATAEAAFERALYGLEEETIAPSLTGETKPLPISRRDEDDPSIAASSHPAPVHGHATPNLETTSGSVPVQGAHPLKHTPATVAADGSGDSHAELGTEDPPDCAEDEQLFEVDEHGPEPPFSPLGKAPVRTLVEPDDRGADADVKPKRIKVMLRGSVMEPPFLPPPPTVSMVCTLSSGNDDNYVTEDRGTLQDALFGLTDHQTSVVTHLDPADRVESCMPLLDRASKLDLFYESGWLLQLQEQENEWISQVGTHGIERASAIATKESTAVAPAEERALESTALPQLPEGASTRLTPPPTHREVVGRSKVLRCLVYRLLRAPHLWWDQVQELVWMAAAEAQTKDAERRGKQRDVKVDSTSCNVAPPSQEAVVADETDLGVLPLYHVISVELMQSAMTRIFGTRPPNVHFFSGALRREIEDLYRGTLRATSVTNANTTSPSSSASPSASLFSALTGPAAAWKAFVLTHRLDQTRVCEPHVKPFSYGEIRPTITAAELTPLRYCNAAASWPSPHDGDAGEGAVGDGARGSANALKPYPNALANRGEEGAAAAKEDSWLAMDEREQNAFLFGEESAQLSTQLRSSDGIFLVYGQDGVTFEEEDKFNASEEALRKAKEQEEEEQLQLLQQEELAGGAVLRLSPLKRARAEEMERVRLYDVDRVVLELTDTEGRFGTPGAVGGGGIYGEHEGGALSYSASLSSPSTVVFPPTESFPLPTSGRSRGRGARSRQRTNSLSAFQLHLQNREDVQLAALWQRFVNAPTGDLIDNLVHVQRHAAELLRAAAVELALQKAFWLLFYARDEVRAVTHPRRTYETVWRLHVQLLELLALTPQGEHPGDAVDGEHSSAAKLAEQKKMAAAPPAFEHLPLSSQVSYACFGCSHVPLRRHCQPAPSISALPHPCGHPYALYEALVERARAFATMRSPASEADCGSISEALPLSDAYHSLDPRQQFAVGFCIPQNASELAEMALRTAEPPAGRDTAAQLLPEAVAPESVVALRSHSKRSAKIAQWVDGAREHMRVALIERAAEAAEIRRLMDAPQRQRGRPPAKEWHSPETAEREEKSEDIRPVFENAEDEGASAREEAAGPMTSAGAPVGGEGMLRRESMQLQARDALEEAVYRCFCSLRATGMLPTPSSSRGGRTPPLTAAQQSAIRRAVDAIAASFHISAGEPLAETSSKPTAQSAKEGSADGVKVEDQAAVVNAGAAYTSAASPRRRARRGLRDATVTSKAVAAKETPSAAVECTQGGMQLRPKQQQRSPAAAEPPAKRKRGRPPRVMNPDGTYTKAAYVHSAAYLEKKQKQRTSALAF
ncbi:hypothetical protein ABL78_6053 [Leptomonas seymouri]|uniref:Uncharacterized protein n=1 Tax=Leptomonas seymouri TaxID=5684 RepID=A0A0N1PD51_LEPSE|nr:hypothetical protein ABL78_6053 [Leptomonas seymouri]|eukprot:KPI84898.1 hypothetical protein ABL78_6053 [Leptomonas seymouri]